MEISNNEVRYGYYVLCLGWWNMRRNGTCHFWEGTFRTNEGKKCRVSFPLSWWWGIRCWERTSIQSALQWLGWARFYPSSPTLDIEWDKKKNTRCLSHREFGIVPHHANPAHPSWQACKVLSAGPGVQGMKTCCFCCYLLAPTQSSERRPAHTWKCTQNATI